jgi:hypothetical protein
MKTTLSVALAAASALMYSILTPTASAQTSPSVPVGWLTTSSNMVRAGTNPTLKWSISYPATVVDYVTVTVPATVTPKQTLEMKVRVLGAGVTSSNSNGSNLTFVPTEATISVAGSSYQRIFYGNNNSVDPSKVVFSRDVKAGEAVRFGGRYFFNSAWGPTYTSTSGTNNVRTLVNGQTPPTTYPLYTAPTLENFIKPYLDSAGKVKIGPMDVIVFMELTHTDSQADQQGYDLQDMVLLVTFDTKK